MTGAVKLTAASLIAMLALGWRAVAASDDDG
jgi:hypothetical protein